MVSDYEQDPHYSLPITPRHELSGIELLAMAYKTYIKGLEIGDMFSPNKYPPNNHDISLHLTLNELSPVAEITTSNEEICLSNIGEIEIEFLFRDLCPYAGISIKLFSTLADETPFATLGRTGGLDLHNPPYVGSAIFGANGQTRDISVSTDEIDDFLQTILSNRPIEKETQMILNEYGVTNTGKLSDTIAGLQNLPKAKYFIDCLIELDADINEKLRYIVPLSDGDKLLVEVVKENHKASELTITRSTRDDIAISDNKPTHLYYAHGFSLLPAVPGCEITGVEDLISVFSASKLDERILRKGGPDEGDLHYINYVLARIEELFDKYSLDAPDTCARGLFLDNLEIHPPIAEY